MPPTYHPPAMLTDFDKSANPQQLYDAWSSFIEEAVMSKPEVPAWYAPAAPPSGDKPASASPPWQGLPNTAVLLEGSVEAAAKAVDVPVPFGSGKEDALLVKEPGFFKQDGSPVTGVSYRPQDEYLEWVTLRDPDGVVREVWFTCEPPEYWNLIAEHDPALLVTLYGELLGVEPKTIDKTKLFFAEEVTHVEPFAGEQTITYKAGSYNPYNDYNAQGAIHLTQGANTLGAEIALAMQGSLLWGNPPKIEDPALICCAAYGVPNRHSDPTIGNMVNTLARAGNYVTLRDPIGLYMDTINASDFTDWNGQAIANFADYFQPLRKSADGSMIVRAKFSVPEGVMKNSSQARVGDLQYQGTPISWGGQIADAITMHLFAEALPGAPKQQAHKCIGQPCPDPKHPGIITIGQAGQPCPNVVTPPPPHPAIEGPHRLMTRQP